MVAIARSRQAALEQPIDRRVFGRRRLTLQAEARRTDHTLLALRQPSMVLEVEDVSLSGLSALSEQPVERGEHIIVRLPAQKCLPEWDAFGRVIRCEPSALGYRLAVEFDPLPAA